MANNDKKLITAEEINKLYREHIEKPMEEAHPPAKAVLERHMADKTAHDIPRRIKEVLLKHKQDPNAHQDALKAMEEALRFHSHLGLAERSLKQLKPALDFHIEYGHPALRARYRRVYIFGNPHDWKVLYKACLKTYYRAIAQDTWRGDLTSFYNLSILDMLDYLLRFADTPDLLSALPKEVYRELSSDITSFEKVSDLKEAVAGQLQEILPNYCYVLDLYSGQVYFRGGEKKWKVFAIRRVK
jgi:hypothetical protein